MAENIARVQIPLEARCPQHKVYSCWTCVGLNKTENCAAATWHMTQEVIRCALNINLEQYKQRQARLWRACLRMSLSNSQAMSEAVASSG
jgi:hypothetical protein